MVRSGSSRDPLLLRNWREERAGASAIHQRNGVWRRARTSAVLLAVLGCAAAVLALVVAASIAGAGDTVELVIKTDLPHQQASSALHKAEAMESEAASMRKDAASERLQVQHLVKMRKDRSQASLALKKDASTLRAKGLKLKHDASKLRAAAAAGNDAVRASKLRVKHLAKIHSSSKKKKSAATALYSQKHKLALQLSAKAKHMHELAAANLAAARAAAASGKNLHSSAVEDSKQVASLAAEENRVHAQAVSLAAESKGDAKKSRGLVDMVSHDRGVHAELARRASPGSAVGDVESPGHGVTARLKTATALAAEAREAKRESLKAHTSYTTLRRKVHLAKARLHRVASRASSLDSEIAHDRALAAKEGAASTKAALASTAAGHAAAAAKLRASHFATRAKLASTRRGQEHVKLMQEKRSVSSKNKAAGAASRESSSLLAKATTEAGESAAAKKEAAAFRVASVALSKAARDDELSASVAENRSAQLRAYASSRLVASSSSAKLHMLMKSDGVIGNRMKDVQLLAHHSHALKNVLKEKPLRLTEMARQADRAARSA